MRRTFVTRAGAAAMFAAAALWVGCAHGSSTTTSADSGTTTTTTTVPSGKTSTEGTGTGSTAAGNYTTDKANPNATGTTTSPPMEILPDVGATSRLIIRSVVVLPQPEGPSRTQVSPAPTSRSTPSTAVVVPCDVV